jgi:hypothetical protein
MSRVVPSQVVLTTRRMFPHIPEGMSSDHAPLLAATLSMVEQIPHELITLDEDDYRNYVVSIAVLRSSINSWERRGNVRSSTTVPGHGHALKLLLECLEKCPDQGIASATVTLPFISDPAFEENIRMDISASNQALINGEWKAATVLAGSVIEALLLYALQEIHATDPTIINNARSGLTRNPGPNLENWKFYQLIDVAEEIDVITEDTATQSRLAKDFRNLIHPGRSIRIGQECDRGSALSAIAAIEHVVRDLTP